MSLSRNNTKLLLLNTHQDIEEYADFLVTQILEKKNFDFMTYPPNCGLTEAEINELQKLEYNESLKNALRKLIADNTAEIIFNMLCVVDGTADPKVGGESWTGVKLVDLEQNENAEPINQFLHDLFYETYWEWREMRGNNE